MHPLRVMITGGGTAGHINPAIAIANIIKKNCPDAEILFVGTKEGKEADLVPRAGYNMQFIEVKGFKRSLAPSNIKTFYLASVAPQKAKRMIKKFKADLVIGTGAYVSWPLLKGAAKTKVPMFLHESNVNPGLTIRLVEKDAKVIFTNFKETADHLKNPEKAYYVGNPLLSAFKDIDRKKARESLGLLDDDFFVLSFGGSVGSTIFNNAMVDAFLGLASLNWNLVFTHACGKQYYDEMQKTLSDNGLNHAPNIKILDYIYDMPKYMVAADLVITRPGALTISELACTRKVSILIPETASAENYQLKNATAMAEKGAACLLLETELHKGVLAKTVEKLFNDKNRCEMMSRKISYFHNEDVNELIWGKIKENLKIDE